MIKEERSNSGDDEEMMRNRGEGDGRRNGEALLQYTSALRCCFREDSELNEVFMCLSDESSLLPAHEH